MSIDDVTHITYDGTISRDDEEAMLDAEQASALPLDVIWGMGHWTLDLPELMWQISFTCRPL